MVTKKIIITQEAYDRLVKNKREHESFSDVIVKRFPRHSLLELVGVWPKEDVEKLKEYIMESRRGRGTRTDCSPQRSEDS